MAASMALLAPCQNRSIVALRSRSVRNVSSLQRPVRVPVNRVPQIHASSAAALSQPIDPRNNGVAPLQRLCKSLLVGVAAAATWSVLASAVCGPSAPFASLTLTAGTTEASGNHPKTQEHACLRAAEILVESTQPAVCLSLSAAGASVAAKSAWAGLAAGFLHTLCGPDHLAVRALRGLAASACQGSSRLRECAGITTASPRACDPSGMICCTAYSQCY
jgi:hypothetical protein